MVIQLLQFLVLIILSFTMFFGIGFILNMLLKTTWLPIIAYLVFVVIMAWSWGSDTLLGNLQRYSLWDYTPFVFGLCGAVLSGYVIRWLRRKGYRMF